MLRYRVYEDRKRNGYLIGYRVVIEKDRVAIAEKDMGPDGAAARALVKEAEAGRWQTFDTQIVPLATKGKGKK